MDKKVDKETRIGLANISRVIWHTTINSRDDLSESESKSMHDQIDAKVEDTINKIQNE
jgi:hypothetical protein